MQFKWIPSKNDLATKFTINVFGNKPITLYRDQSFNFESESQYKNYKARFEQLLASGLVVLEERNYKKAAPVEVPKPIEDTKPQDDAPTESEVVEDSPTEIVAISVPADFYAMTTKQLRKLATEAGHSVDKSLKKPELIALLQG